MKILLVTNIKGGVGKSTTSVSIATGIKLLEPNARILLLDGDPQGSIKTNFGLKLGPYEDFSTFLIEDTPFENSIRKLMLPNVGEIDVMISSRKLAEADLRMAAFPRREETLLMRFKQQCVEYDYCIIDSSPSDNLVWLNFMIFADYWLIPSTMDAFSVGSIAFIFDKKKVIEKHWEKSPKIIGVLPTMFDKRLTVAKVSLEAVKKEFSSKTKIFEPIPQDAMVERSQLSKEILYEYLDVSKAANAYKDFSAEVLGILNG